MQELDEKRTRGIREFIIGAANVESSVAPIIGRCLEGIVKAGEAINEKEDSYKVIERFAKKKKPKLLAHAILYKKIYFLF